MGLLTNVNGEWNVDILRIKLLIMEGFTLDEIKLKLWKYNLLMGRLKYRRWTLDVCQIVRLGFLVTKTNFDLKSFCAPTLLL